LRRRGGEGIEEVTPTAHSHHKRLQHKTNAIIRQILAIWPTIRRERSHLFIPQESFWIRSAMIDLLMRRGSLVAAFLKPWWKHDRRRCCGYFTIGLVVGGGGGF
jgi:hypothetical protein